MRTFAHKQERRQPPLSSVPAWPLSEIPGLPQRAEERSAGVANPIAPRLGHEFGQMSVYPPATGPIQTKLEISRPGDASEREADRLAERVLRMPEPRQERTGDGAYPTGQAEQTAQEQDRVQPRHVGSDDLDQSVAPPAVAEVVSSPGQPLDAAPRTLMEPRFGHDFSRVQVHTDAKAAESARAIHAQAYAAGSDVVFAPGRYAPGTTEGNRLLAHELAHVVQQTGAIQRYPDEPPAEQANVTDLRQDMARQIDLWENACRAGIGEFVHAELASQIDGLSEGNWNSFFQILAGNTVWAAAAFATGGAAFAISMIGIGIATVPTIPKKGSSKDELSQIEDSLHSYIEKAHRKLDEQLPTKAAELLKAHPGISLKDGVKLFLEASFKPDMLRHDPAVIDETAVRQTMRDSATRTLALLREISKVDDSGDITEVALLTPPDFSMARIVVVRMHNPGPGPNKEFVRWIPDEDQDLARATQIAKSKGSISHYGFEDIEPSADPTYLMWLMQHGWKSEDGFGWEWLKRREQRATAAK